MYLPSISSYGNNDNKNATIVVIGTITMWFSYKTLIAFRVDGKSKVVLNYTDSNTTYKHLNMIEPDKAQRLNDEEFQAQWDKQIEPIIRRI